MKKIISLTISFLVVLLVFSSCGKEEKKETQTTTVKSTELTQTNIDEKGYLDGTYSYEILEDGTAKIIKYKLEDKIDYPIYIPSQLDGKDVTVIGEGAFKNCKTIREIHFPDTLVKIEKDAFRGSSLADAELYTCRNLESIDDYAFADCDKLVKIDLLPSVKTFGKGVFSNDPALKIVTLRGNFTNLDASLFEKSGAFKVCTREESSDTVKFAKDNGYEIKYL